MYRLFKMSGFSLQNAYKQPSIQYSPRICNFCNIYHYKTFITFDHLQLRHSSSMNNALLTTTGKRKIKRKNKKYAEILEVTDSATNNKRAAVQNLNAAQLSILVDRPDIELDNLHKIENKHIIKKNKSTFRTTTSKSIVKDQILSSSVNFSKFPETFNNDTIEQSKQDEVIDVDEKGVDESIVEELETSGVSDTTVLIKSSSLVESLVDSTDDENLQKNIEEDNLEKTDGRENKEALILEEKLKQFNKMLLAYVNVCINSHEHKTNQNLEERIINYYRKNKKYNINNVFINDISVYNALIEKLASNADLRKILKVLESSRQCGIRLNAQTFAHTFECIGRLDISNEHKLDILKQIQSEMNYEGISLNDVITKSEFVRDQRIFVEKMIKLLNEQFEPLYSVPDTGYDCKLLEGLIEENATPTSTVDGLLKISDLEERLKKQIEMEINGYIEVHNISKKNSSQNATYWRNKLSNLEKTWEKVALAAFKKNLKVLKSREKYHKVYHFLLHPYLSILNPEDYVKIIMKEVQKLGMGSEMYSSPFNSLCRQLGIQVYKQYETKLKKSNGVNDKISEVYMQYCDWFIKRNDKCNIRKKWTLLEHEANKKGVTLNAQVPSWQSNIHIGIGRFLFNIIVSDLKLNLKIIKKNRHLNKKVPAFFKIFRHSGVMLKEEVKPHPTIAKMYRDSQLETLTFDTTLVPSLCPPRPWVSIYSGGYIVTKSEIVRATAGNQQWEKLVNSPAKKLYPSLDSLNQLGSIPWSINSSVLDVAIKVFQNDGSVELNMPQPPSVLPPIPPIPKDATTETKNTIYKMRIETKRKKNEMYSLWCDALYRLSLANHFRNDIFWLPHNMDFRGRVYPVPPHLNHLGSDLARSMLIFALKKPLGPNGLNWLKLHTINLTGFKKRDPVSERLKYADEVMDKILDSAEKPLTGEMWWSTSDEPWQTLAACMEIAAALKSPNCEEYMTGFPIHQDGSCNGLQHYAALGRDQIGAESVNLHPCDRPQDVYSSVAAMVDERRKEDAEKGNMTAKVLEGFIKRKVIKQTVMTTVYGVTWFGAKLQIARQLKDIDNFPQEHIWMASTYLVQKTFQTLRTMFKSAREIQDWFTECARLISSTCDANMEWVTPLGLPVIQPYSKLLQNKIQSHVPYFTPDIYRKPNVMKQKNAFAPNFVHSLDSSHMMLTSIYSEHIGITFVSVHDCYWTHPCTVEIMNKICREQFVALHSEPILEDLSKFLVEKFAYQDFDDKEKKNAKKTSDHPLKDRLNSTLVKVPKQGEFNLKGVLSSTYFFS